MRPDQIRAEVARERAMLEIGEECAPARSAWDSVRPEPLVSLPAEAWRRVTVRLRRTKDPEANLWARQIELQCGLGS